MKLMNPAATKRDNLFDPYELCEFSHQFLAIETTMVLHVSHFRWLVNHRSLMSRVVRKDQSAFCSKMCTSQYAAPALQVSMCFSHVLEVSPPDPPEFLLKVQPLGLRRTKKLRA